MALPIRNSLAELTVTVDGRFPKIIVYVTDSVEVVQIELTCAYAWSGILPDFIVLTHPYFTGKGISITAL